MRFTFLLVAIVAAIQNTQAQTSGTILIEDSANAGSYAGAMSTSFIGLKLPSGGGSVSITFAPGDSADNSYVTSYADHTQAGPYVVGGASTSFTITQTGHYWVYLSAWGRTDNFDWLEIRVEASTYSGPVLCYYCAPPSGWKNGWPPLGTHQLLGPVSSHPASAAGVPAWAISVLAVVIGLALLASCWMYRGRMAKNSAANAATKKSAEKQPPVELANTTIV